MIRRVGAVLALLLVLASCGLGDKQARADRIIDAVDLARAQRTAVGTYAVTARIVEIPVEAGVTGGLGITNAGGQQIDPTKLGFPPELVASVGLDLERDRAVLSLPKRAGFAVFDDLALYGRKFDATAREARPWLTLDLRDLDDSAAGLDPTRDNPNLLQLAINPSVMLDLVGGALTGSVEAGTPDDVNGVRTTRYAANFDLEKTLRDTRRDGYDEDRREALERSLEVMGLRGTVHSGAVWLDDLGLPRRFQVDLDVEPIRGFRIEVRLRLDLAQFGVPVEVVPPEPGALVAIEDLPGYLRSIVPAQTSGLGGLVG